MAISWGEKKFVKNDIQHFERHWIIFQCSFPYSLHMLWEGLIKVMHWQVPHTYIQQVLTLGYSTNLSNTLAKHCDNKMTQPSYSNHYFKCIVSKKTQTNLKDTDNTPER